MNEPEYQKKIVILYNMASGTVDLFHDDDLTYPELMGLLGMAQMILFRDYVNETEE